MKKQLWFGALCVAIAAVTVFGCATPTRQYLYDQQSETAKKAADILGKWQAKTLDDALHFATQGKQEWTEQREAYIVEKTLEGKLDAPIVIRSIAWYDNVLRSIDADIALINGLKAQADAVGAAPAP